MGYGQRHAAIRSTEWDESTLRTALEAAERLARGAHGLTHDNEVKGDRLN